MRRIRLAVLLVSGLLVATTGARRAWDGVRIAASGRRSAATLDPGRYIEARSRLVVLSARWPEDGEACYYLGDCESKLGDERAAVAAWSRVDDASPLSGLAAVRLARRALRTHRFAEAEDLMRKALGDRGRHAIEARETLVNLFKIQGRYREAERLVRDGADRYPDKLGLLKELAQLGSINPHRLDLVRDGLEKAASTAPDDDRVLLGRANLATRTGRYEEAAGWLDRCRLRPDDPAVWRGRLELAMATDDADGGGKPSAACRATRSPTTRCSSCAGSRPPPVTPNGKSRPCGGLWAIPRSSAGPGSDSRSWCPVRGASRNLPSFAAQGGARQGQGAV